jgi:hypothetical protein
MLVVFVTSVFFAIAMTVVIVALLTKDIDDRAARIVFFLVGALSPLMLIVSGIRTLVRQNRELAPCPDLLARVEAEIEEERVETFGGKLLNPALAARWQAAYLESLGRTASRVDAVVMILISAEKSTTLSKAA